MHIPNNLVRSNGQSTDFKRCSSISYMQYAINAIIYAPNVESNSEFENEMFGVLAFRFSTMILVGMLGGIG